MHCARRSMMIAGIACATLFSVGCGSPDLSKMQPTVRKRTVEVLLVNQPHGWSKSDIQSTADQNQIVLNVTDVTDQSVATTLNQDVRRFKGVTLYVVVMSGSIPPEIQQISTGSTQTRFEWIHTGKSMPTAMNVKDVTPDASAVCYATAWLAGQMSQANGLNTIGWVTDGQTEVSKANAMAAFGGLFSADNRVNVVPVILGTKPTILPKFIIAPRALSTEEWKTVAMSGSVVFSLVVQGGASQNPASVPALPPLQVLQEDFAGLASGSWKAGNSSVVIAPFLTTRTDNVPPMSTDALQAMEVSIQSDSTIVTNAWSSVPTNIQQMFLPYIANAQS